MRGKLGTQPTKYKSTVWWTPGIEGSRNQILLPSPQRASATRTATENCAASARISKQIQAHPKSIATPYMTETSQVGCLPGPAPGSPATGAMYEHELRIHHAHESRQKRQKCKRKTTYAGNCKQDCPNVKGNPRCNLWQAQTVDEHQIEVFRANARTQHIRTPPQDGSPGSKFADNTRRKCLLLWGGQQCSRGTGNNWGLQKGSKPRLLEMYI